MSGHKESFANVRFEAIYVQTIFVEKCHKLLFDKGRLLLHCEAASSLTRYACYGFQR
jgi:hypothetical protein